MKRLIRTTLSTWKMNPKMVEKLKDSLEEVGTIDVTSYRSKFHFFQFFKGTFNIAGQLFEERIPLNMKERTEGILAAYGLYTGGWHGSMRSGCRYSSFQVLRWLCCVHSFLLQIFHLHLL